MANFNIVYSRWFSLKLTGIAIFFSKLANHSLNRNILNGMNFKRYSACFPSKSLQSSGQERNTNKQWWHNAKWNEFSRGTRKVRVLGKAPGRRWHLRSVRIWRCGGEERKRDPLAYRWQGGKEGDFMPVGFSLLMVFPSWPLALRTLGSLGLVNPQSCKPIPWNKLCFIYTYVCVCVCVCVCVYNIYLVC